MSKKIHFRKKSILVKMVASLMIPLVLMFAILCGTIFCGGMTQQLRKNAFDILEERVASRRDNLQVEMVQQWANINESMDFINEQADKILSENGVEADAFTADSPLSGTLINTVSERLMYQLRRSAVTGIFLILNGAEPISSPAVDAVQTRAGFYLRDYDPDTSPNNNSDFMLERAPMAFVKDHSIALDTYWQPTFVFRADENNDYYYRPYQAALSQIEADAENLGYWGTPSALNENGDASITYSLPLLTADGKPYGVLGVEISVEMLIKKMPYNEINGDIKGSYVLVQQKQKEMQFDKMVSSGPYFKTIFGAHSTGFTLEETPVEGDSYAVRQDVRDAGKVYGSVQYLKLYNSNTPFENEQWALIGILQDETLLALYHNIKNYLWIALISAFSIGIGGVVWVGLHFAKPITQLAQNVRESDPTHPVHLKKIDVAEIDELSTAVETLSQSVAESYSTLSTIMALAGYRIGAFEYLADSQTVKYTDAFFAVLGFAGPNEASGTISMEEFRRLLAPLSTYPKEKLGESTIYRLPTSPENPVWVRLQFLERETKTLGVVIDVTLEMRQRKQLEYERDYDALTMLKNRRAFHAEMENIFAHKEKITIAAMVMMDLDNLKYINDTYGHDIGDAYLRCAADTLRNCSDENMIVARMSGDEFYVFIKGETRAEVEHKIHRLERCMHGATLQLPDGMSTHVRISAGIAWYPKDAQAFLQLISYADFAMYRVKHTTKGKFAEFNYDNYNRESFLLKNKEELNKLIDGSLVDYHFQIIANAADGTVYAYEALMRPTLPVFASPIDVLAIAHSQSKLYEIERLTWFKALASFTALSTSQNAEKLFINSIPNQLLAESDIAVIKQRYQPYLSRIVMELTEDEKPNNHFTLMKTRVLKSWGAQVALDDFGTGYNGEAALLLVSPEYVKVDQSIVRHIDTNLNKRHIVENIMNYANQYHIKVIAEGIETSAELQTVLACGVQYLQGYYIGKPQKALANVPKTVQDEICATQAALQKQKQEK
mgnify:FL=1